MEPSPWMGPPENMSGIQKLQFSLTKKKTKNIYIYKTNGTQSLDGPPENMSGIQKLQFSLTKKQKKTTKNKIKTNPLACFLGDPSRDSVPFVFFCFFIDFVLFISCFFLIFPLGPMLDLFFWFDFFLFFLVF